ncbi:hypothetical protein AB0M20_27035 [Actinoplanes sp. NPDC051633]|uniref:hypothetical protein n=1 Tax=Actinoplanes sp. NPDC051633 TaxID=3155670 RepID=UPI0034344A49
MPIGAFLESGPKEAALRQLRRSVPEAAAELEKLAPGSAATILHKWPDELVAEILAAMDVHLATAILLARPSTWRIVPVMRKMPKDFAIGCLNSMGDVSMASGRLGWTGPWFLPKALRSNDDPLFADIHNWRRTEAKTTTMVLVGFAAVLGASLGVLNWHEERKRAKMA